MSIVILGVDAPKKTECRCIDNEQRTKYAICRPYDGITLNTEVEFLLDHNVTPRMRRVSRNVCPKSQRAGQAVTPRMRRVSRNFLAVCSFAAPIRHASHEACE